ncbi:DsbA family protein [Sulfitobacter sp. CW3]|uniref:DsbA family protein n=1 Tax=Sulfitobacter sp. CW3 TaxID=2861965 RepID=UPI001C600430|nr:DsbA family protein [Sulfitobacter sp. CW3]MBW4962720.1 DsbA family protein [Sulfitobacter sp. CW3]
MKRTFPILAAVAAVAVGGWFVFSGTDATNSTQLNPIAGAANAQSAEAADVDTSTIQEMSLGNPESAVQIVEYASFTCPHCAAFDQGAYKQLKADYIDTNKIGFTYREVYFDRYGLWASMVARCGGQEKFHGIADLIYKGQSEWVRAGEPAAIVEELRKIGRLAGIENDTLEACLQDGEKAQTLVAWWEENQKTDDITSTPSFIINGKKYSNMPYAEMKEIIDAALAD